jgi:hypothetical protein
VDWITGGGLVVAVLALVVAVVALVVQWRTHRSALEAQATESREGRRHAETLAREDREHALTIAREDRLWTRRGDLYARILEAMRRRIEEPEATRSVPPPDDPNLTSLATQAHVLASSAVLELLNEFVYGDVDDEEQINIWVDLQNVVKRELGIPRD